MPDNKIVRVIHTANQSMAKIANGFKSKPVKICKAGKMQVQDMPLALMSMRNVSNTDTA